jgi:cephalosporin hydroxylase
MRITIDTGAATVTDHEAAPPGQVLPLASPEAFALVSKAWLRAGWDVKQVYTFTWLGRPIIQLPEDLVRIQEAIFQTRPNVIIETGVAHGGGLVFFASLLKLIHGDARARVIGVDIEIRPHNRAAIEAHFLSPAVHLVEGDSASPETLARVRSLLEPEDRVMVVLDSCHYADHVLAELRAYGDLVAPGCHLVATDGIMRDLEGAPRSREDWGHNHPVAAVHRFLAEDSRFTLSPPPFAFNESVGITEPVTYWPESYLLRSPLP